MKDAMVAGSSSINWTGVAVIAGGGVAVIVTDLLLGAPLAGWHGALAASGFAGALTAMLAYAFSHGH
jgi:hypothetical protein